MLANIALATLATGRRLMRIRSLAVMDYLSRSQLEFRGQVIPLTASFGAAVIGPQETLDSLVRRADAAMYAAKRLGRNRVETDPGSVNPQPM